MASPNAALQPSPTTNWFLTALPTAGSTQASSVISSQMTDLGSENGDDYRAAAGAPPLRPDTAMPGGAFPNDPNRPPSAMSSQPRSWTHSQTSRRGFGSPRTLGSWRVNGAFGGPGTSMSNSSRPESNNSSRTSKTHVPSLASHAFFRPMSSQRLQAQRGIKRPSARGPSITSLDGASDFGSRTNRNSVGSNITVQPGPETSQQRDAPPQSIVTDFTERGEQPTTNASLVGNATNQSMGGSERPLNDRSLRVDALPSMPEKNHKQGNGFPSTVRQSPRSFRPSFLLPTRSSDQARNNRFSHEHLSSSNSSPLSVNAKVISEATKTPGFNYEYFTGNTIFCWGGRLQNTRDRPINIISSLLIILPSILFFTFS